MPLKFYKNRGKRKMGLFRGLRTEPHHVIPFFAYPAEIRRIIYTTNAIESLNMTLRKVIKNKRFFPSDDAIFKQLYLSLQNIMKKWTMCLHNWNAAINYFSIEFSDRMPANFNG
jgi:putative transposase